MRIIAKCPACNAPWLLDEKHQDRRVRCKKCGRAFRVPALEDVPRAAEIIRRSNADVYADESGKTYG